MVKKRLLLRIIVWIIIAAMVAAYIIDFVFAAPQAIPSTPPQNITVSDIGYESAGGENWYVRFSWSSPYFPPEATGDKTQIFYFNRVQRGTGTIVEDVLSFTLNDAKTSFSTAEYGIDLEHGTIYEFYGRSSYRYGDLGEYEFVSGKSNRVKFLTDLEFGAELISGTNDIKIVWDDVWDTNGRIDYRILISDTSGFTQPPAIPDIIGSDIGTEKSQVTVAGGRLEYVYTNAMPGREYSIKIIPLVGPNVSVIDTGKLPVVKVKTDILLRAKKMGETSTSVRWMLFWDPIIKGAIGSTTFTHVEYKLYRYNKQGQGTFFALITDKDRYEMILSFEDVEKYTYKIEALAYKPDGSTVPFYSSTQVSLKEQVPEYPASPAFVNGFPNASPSPLMFDELLTKSEATLLWTVPVTGEGKTDNEIYYDLYMVDRIEDIEELPLTKKVGSNLSMSTQNEVREKETGRLIGYRYTVGGLKPNSTYYAVMLAKKNFLVESEDGNYMVTMPFMSEPAIKVIITRPDTEPDKPSAPPSPPFRLKPGNDSIDKTTVILQMEKSWTEMFNQDMGKWLYVVRQDDPEAGTPNSFYNQYNSFSYQEYADNQSLPADQRKPVRTVVYGAGWQINIHCVEYLQALDIVERLKGRSYITYGDLKENYLLSLQRPVNPVLVPDIAESQPQTFSMPVQNLKSNTAYLFWITVKSGAGLLESEPSDPIIITTLPNYPPVVEIPTVPTDLKGIPTDSFVDLFWSFREGYTYNIRYGTEDDLNKASGSATVSTDQLRYEPWHRIGGLEANTVYYFWIQAQAPASAGGAVSGWSNSLIVKTQPYSPPPRPRGFGIKAVPDAITENSVFYEWLPDESVTYILEVSEFADFSDSTEYPINGSEYNVTGLKSNRRYFARLFAYSAKTQLRSEPTPVVMVVTRKGRGEYDADVPIEDIPVGDMVEIDGIAVDGVWNARVIGINAHRLSEKLRQAGTGTFCIDLSNPPPNTKIIRLELGAEVLETLAGIRQNLMVKTPAAEITLLPGSFLQDTYFRLKQRLGDITIRIDVRTPVQELIPERNRRFVMPATEMKVLAGLDKSYMPLGNFAQPVRISLPAEPEDTDKLEPRLYDAERGGWENVNHMWLPLEEKLAVYPLKSGAVAVTGVQVGSYPDMAGRGLEKTIENILSLYDMPSIPAGSLNPDKKLTVAEGMKHLMDVIPYDYGNENVNEKALRAGLLHPQYQKEANAPLRRDEAIYAAMMLLRRKLRTEISGDENDLRIFTDYNSILGAYRQAVAFAAGNGIIESNYGILAPQETITRAEMLKLIEKVLFFAGEL